MSFVVHVRTEAQAEVDEVFDNYESIKSGLGGRFTDAFDACLKILERNPFFQKRRNGYRYIMVSKFPYRVVFEVIHQDVFIYQVRYASRQGTTEFGP